MQWPSQNVPKGGIFQPHKINYSQETKDFIKVLMDETKMSTSQRNKINYYLRNGEPLPNLYKEEKKRTKKQEEVLIRPGSSKRRMYSTIVDSGAYERDKFKPQHPRFDRDLAKKHLQDVMAYGKEVKVKTNLKVKKKKEASFDEFNRFDQLMQEIKDREDWLREMEELGEADKHRLIIQQQIQARLREIEKLKISSAEDRE